MKTSTEVLEWAQGVDHRGYMDTERATAARIAKALRVLEVVEKWDDTICDALQYGKCSDMAWEALRAALDDEGAK